MVVGLAVGAVGEADEDLGFGGAVGVIWVVGAQVVAGGSGIGYGSDFGWGLTQVVSMMVG